MLRVRRDKFNIVSPSTAQAHSEPCQTIKMEHFAKNFSSKMFGRVERI